MRDKLTTREAAHRLGVKPETVYAYVSRGLLSSTPESGKRGSLFDPKEVEALLRRGGRARASAIAGDSSRLLALDTGITLIEADRFYLRGVDAVELADAYTYEEAAYWLWTGTMMPGKRFPTSDDAVAAARHAVAALPEHAGIIDQFRVATAAAASVDPVRFDLSDDVVLMTAQRLIVTLTAVLGPTGATSSTPSSTSPIAEQLWHALAVVPANPDLVQCVDSALVLLLDHDLAASTLAARAAASAHANPYAVISAALGAFEGALHGGASFRAHGMLADALDRGSANTVMSTFLREGQRIPGLGHRIYAREDPRASMLLSRFADLPATSEAARMALDISSAAARTGRPLYPNIDLALAALTVSAGMPSEAGEALFAIARIAGWIAHALEEYAERPLRLRPSGRYVGPRPPQALP